MATHSLKKMLTAVDRWYRRQGRILPWRIGPKERDQGVKPDPYLVWLSEVMLQQTTIPHAAPYFEAFSKRWPRVGNLAGARWEDVSAAWAGLGYYSRARNLHACAQAVAELGGFPQEARRLKELPGIGPYTAAAIASIAFDERVAPVDGNIERVVSRLWAIGSDRTEKGWREAKGVIAARAQSLADALPKDGRAGDLAQALMDLGATVCSPRKPNCPLCPLQEFCEARAQGEPERYPVKAEKKARPRRYGSAFIIVRDNKVLLVRRPPSGLLGGMLMPPSSEWGPEKSGNSTEGAPGDLAWKKAGAASHTFTHFDLTLTVWSAEAPKRFSAEGEWHAVDGVLRNVPTVGRKALALVLGGTKER